MVLAYDDDAPGSNDAGKRSVAVLVRVCVSEAEPVGDGPWSLIDAQDGTYATTITGGGLKEPQYLSDNDLSAGECARGWITFEVARTSKIAAAKYAPADKNGDSVGIARWKVHG